MRIHHLNCGTDCPLGGALFDGRSTSIFGEIVCHCLLVETNAHGLVLVDTGYGLRDVAHPHRRPDPRITLAWRTMLNIRLHERETAIRQVEALGYQATDVRHIIATHLDFDHAGGLEDFPKATVHVMKREYDDALGPHRGIVAQNRWRRRQLDEVAGWRTYGARGEPWFGFDAVRNLEGLPPEILMVPLPGHTWGHAGVAIDRGAAGWLLHAGDAYFYRGEMRSARRRCTPGLCAYQRLMEVDATSRLNNQARLRALSVEKRDEVTVTCTHDPVELERCQAGLPL
ncbi:glyoxylase-like metal-dependent hydrolase (beta-lactamase superfamily II) [Sphingomonas jejuensis]|uniref:Glyoxylase-like metal-dependent hydrolase (Beta-lactamase superfamily II) n=1 Tax=Sphingomonas jejuensis TaxID=904715 RepID=A0ABX0XMC4_9SPHN|nr:MBL fold metallo-hydrolase [Sphingomonas jejuensis]NJC34527.1 glyoxylase-like metal-dependent hydrolase (beta-lactamase superfamily II) [Sphingomonas jejuensis]